jgi:filamentous hemagglutinin
MCHPAASHGRQAGHTTYLLRQHRLIKQGRFGEAIQMDIDNIRTLFGNKYDEAIQEMIDQLEPWMKKGLIG